MTSLRRAIEEYLVLRRQLGFKLDRQKLHLREFASFMEGCGASFITTERALQWALRPHRASPAYSAQRLIAVRCFARHHCATDPRTQIPPSDLLPYRARRARPYLYSEKDIDRLLIAAKSLGPTGGFRGHTYVALLGLLAVTGLRISEALSLTLKDVDLLQGLLTIRKTKFGKTRFVPLHATAKLALRRYARQRRASTATESTDRFFVSTQGGPMSVGAVEKTFRLLRRRVGLHASEHCDEPKLHHFRHRFATQTLLRWYHAGQDIESQLPVLSTFLGHVNMASTYWYLSCHPELMRQAMQRLEQRWEKCP
jgi:site-specific recombinase XerD